MMKNLQTIIEKLTFWGVYSLLCVLYFNWNFWFMFTLNYCAAFFSILHLKLTKNVLFEKLYCFFYTIFKWKERFHKNCFHRGKISETQFYSHWVFILYMKLKRKNETLESPVKRPTIFFFHSQVSGCIINGLIRMPFCQNAGIVFLLFYS